MIKVVCFDIGGTLIPLSSPSFIDSLASLINHPSMEFEAKLIQYFGIQNGDIESFCKDLSILNKKSIIENFINSYKPMQKLFDDVLPKLQYLYKQNYILATLSNAISIEPSSLEFCELNNYFSYKIYSYDCGFSKPSKEIYCLLENMLHISSDQILYVSNSLLDILGAYRRGWYCILITRENKMPFSYDPNKPRLFFINNLKMVLEIIENI